jgi:nucleoside diphosphate kinase
MELTKPHTSNSKDCQSTTIEIACAILKPDTVQDGRKDRIVAHLKNFSSENGLILMEEFFTPPDISDKMRRMHFDGKSKLNETGEKVISSFLRRGISEEQMNWTLKKYNLDPKDKEGIGKWITDVEVNSYLGKESYMLIFSGPDAISKLFSIRGGSDPMFAKEGTLRKMFSNGMSIVDMFDGPSGRPIDNVLHIPDTVEEVDRHLVSYTGKGYQEHLNMAKQYATLNKLIR